MLFFRSFFFVTELAFFREHQVFCSRVCRVFLRYESRLPLGCFSRHRCHMFVILTDIFNIDVSREILPPTSYTISRRHWFRQVLDARP